MSRRGQQQNQRVDMTTSGPEEEGSIETAVAQVKYSEYIALKKEIAWSKKLASSRNSSTISGQADV